MLPSDTVGRKIIPLRYRLIDDAMTPTAGGKPEDWTAAPVETGAGVFPASSAGAM
jgi:hypothetical protein